MVSEDSRNTLKESNAVHWNNRKKTWETVLASGRSSPGLMEENSLGCLLCL